MPCIIFIITPIGLGCVNNQPISIVGAPDIAIKPCYTRYMYCGAQQLFNTRTVTNRDMKRWKIGVKYWVGKLRRRLLLPTVQPAKNKRRLYNFVSNVGQRKKNTELARGSEPKDLWTKQSNALTLGWRDFSEVGYC